MALEQARWNVSLGVQSSFILLNSPTPHAPREGQDYVWVQNEVGVGELERLLKSNKPRGGTPLAERIRGVRAQLQRTGLLGEGKRVISAF